MSTFIQHTLAAAAFLACIDHAHSQTPELVLARTISDLSVSNGKLVLSTRIDGIPTSDSICLFDGQTMTMIGGSGEEFTGFNGRTFFRRYVPSVGYELFSSDGTATGTSAVANLSSMGAACRRILGVAGNRLFFVGEGEATGLELWATDGTAQGTHLVKDINPGTTGSLSAYGPGLVVLNNKLYFNARNGTTGEELWVSDGTEAGTTMVKDISTGSASSYPNYFTVIGNKIYFSASTEAEGNELWVTDGTAAGTHLVVDATPGTESSDVDRIVAFNNKVYFTARTYYPLGISGAQSIYDMWETDGTQQGSHVFYNEVNGLHVFGGHIYFGKAIAGTRPFSHFELYRTDGTQPGTAFIRTIEGGGSYKAPSYYRGSNGKLYFLCNYDSNGGNYQDHDLWVTDGTTAGTLLIRYADESLVNVSIADGIPVSFQGDLYFSKLDNVEDGVLRRGLFRIDGGELVSSVAERDASAAVWAYPNPASSMLHIRSDEPVQAVSIHNAWGALVRTETRTSFSIEQLPAGVYMVQVSTAKGIGTARLVKE
ncbi:MAG: T9SS type A sorting domain-containing protein [Flavobacteriales bacterium]|nr:T9SS type A sorting domain-containing protein [Flavobacteriales bacterium]